MAPSLPPEEHDRRESTRGTALRAGPRRISLTAPKVRTVAVEKQRGIGQSLLPRLLPALLLAWSSSVSADLDNHRLGATQGDHRVSDTVRGRQTPTAAAPNASAAQGKPIAFSKRLGVEVFAEDDGSGWCGPRARLRVVARTAAVFQSAEFADLMRRTGHQVIEVRCGIAKEVLISGFAAGSNVVLYVGRAVKDEGWAVTVVPASEGADARKLGQGRQGQDAAAAVREKEPFPTSPGSTTYRDPFEFCKAATNVDPTGPDGEMNDPRYVGSKVPSAVSKTFDSNNVAWRCMGGQVYGCYMGASGRACQRWKTAKPSPTRSIRDWCAGHPDAFVPNAANDTSSSWLCRGTVPVIDSSVKQPRLDERGYYVEAWKRIAR